MSSGEPEAEPVVEPALSHLRQVSSQFSFFFFFFFFFAIWGGMRCDVCARTRDYRRGNLRSASEPKCCASSCEEGRKASARRSDERLAPDARAIPSGAFAEISVAVERPGAGAVGIGDTRQDERDEGQWWKSAEGEIFSRRRATSGRRKTVSGRFRTRHQLQAL